MREFVIDHPHNEASTLIAIHNHHLLERFGWDVGFWIASDEHPAHKRRPGRWAQGRTGLQEIIDLSAARGRQATTLGARAPRAGPCAALIVSKRFTLFTKYVDL